MRDRYYGTPANVKIHHNGSEIGPSFADALWNVQEFHNQMHKPMQGSLRFPSGKENSLEWMRQQADQHGLYSGHTMTQLLATPSGQQYLKQAMRSGPPPAPAPPPAPPKPAAKPAARPFTFKWPFQRQAPAPRKPVPTPGPVKPESASGDALISGMFAPPVGR